MTDDQTILWRRLAQPGHEFARLSFQESGWHLSGAAVFVHDKKPCRLDYQVICNLQWQTVSSETYQYESAGGRFKAELTVNAAGFVTDYPKFCTLEALS